MHKLAAVVEVVQLPLEAILRDQEPLALAARAIQVALVVHL
tara:strand:- start:161 stop:283 length:123 start_codon:yes stop_codon:yes gene_type:complete